MKYTTSQLRQLEGPKLYRVLGDVLDAFRVIDAAENESSSVDREEYALKNEIVRQAKKIKSKWVKVMVALTPLVSIVLMVVIGVIAVVDYLYQEGVTISLSDMTITNFDGTTVLLREWIAVLLSEFELSQLPEVILALVGAIWFPVTAATVIVYLITTRIDRKRHIKERISALNRRYAADFTALDARRRAADQKSRAMKKQGIYQVAEVILPEHFMCYQTLADLLCIMEKYRLQRLEDGVRQYYEEQHNARMEDMQREQTLAAQRAAAAQERQAKVTEQQARDAERVGRETQYAAQRAADAAERAARAEEERARVARNMEQEYWRNT